MDIIYLDAKDSGISGDIFFSALLQLIENSESILKELETLKDYLPGVSSLQIKLEKIKKNELNVMRLNIQIKEKKNHRSIKQLTNSLSKFLEKNQYSEKSKQYAKNVLNSLIEAEAEIHEDLPEKVHLHELSSVDTLIDILGVTRLLDQLGYFSNKCKVYLNELPLGGGKIKTAHGILPVPAPATMKIIEKSSINVKMGPIDCEITTPTGAALLANLNIDNKSPSMLMKKAVYSTGEKIFENFLNILKLYYGKVQFSKLSIFNEEYEKYHQKIALLETDVDDVTGETIGNFINVMENENILDIQIFQGVTKKNRPSYNIKVLCYPEEVSVIILKMMEEIGTLGVRFSVIDRFCVEREIITSEILLSEKTFTFKYKLSYLESNQERYIINVKPEFEDLKTISRETQIPLKKVDFIAKNQILEEIGK
jgi:hypothetical protein